MRVSKIVETKSRELRFRHESIERLGEGVWMNGRSIRMCDDSILLPHGTPSFRTPFVSPDSQHRDGPLIEVD